MIMIHLHADDGFFIKPQRQNQEFTFYARLPILLYISLTSSDVQSMII